MIPRRVVARGHGVGLLLAALLSAPAAADYEAGLYATDVGDYTTAFAEFARAAAQGDLRAANQLGQLYERGDGVERDPLRAAEWYRRAAEAGNREAQYNLAGMYRNGDGLPLDEALSMQWYMRAAAQRLPIAQFFVGKNFEHGQGTPQDMAEAWAWYSLAAEAGDDGAARNRDRVAKYLGDAQQQRAVTLLRDHALDLALPPSTLRALGVTAPEAHASGAATGADGAGRDTVSAIQQALVELGYEIGVVDGVAGPRTRGALSEFAVSVGMEGDPRLGAQLLEQLRAALAARGLAMPMVDAPATTISEPVASEVPAAAGDEGRSAAAATEVVAASPVPVVEEPPAATPTLARDQAPSRETLRESLRALGYKPVVTDEAEQTALAAFTRDAGLDASKLGAADLLARMDTLRPLMTDTPTGTDLVRAVQLELARLGHDAGTADGVVGSRTRTALAAFAAAAAFPEPPRVTPVLLARLRLQSESGASRVWRTSANAEGVTIVASTSPRESAAVAEPAPTLVEATTEPGDSAPTGVALVRAVQSRLADLGYDPGPVDGLLGARTRRAAAAFRRDRSLAGGATIDAALLTQLNDVHPASAPPVVAPVAGAPSSPPADEIVPVADPVHEAQRILAMLGFDVGEVDGISGTRTRNAVLDFEHAHGYAASGRIDETLLARLREVSAATVAPPVADTAIVRTARQQMLARGYRPGPSEGEPGQQMRDAILAFQHDEGLAASGELDAQTMERLKTDPAPVGASVTLLREVQDALNRLGFDAGPVDGAMGPRTRAAITAFRRAEGLPSAAHLDIAVLRRLGLAAGN